MDQSSEIMAVHEDVQIEVLEEILAGVEHNESGIIVIREIVSKLRPFEGFVEG